MYEPHTIRDRLKFGTEDARRLRMAAFNVIARTQGDPATQVRGMALALYATCTALDIDIRQLLVETERLKDDLDGPFVHVFDAIREYARNEIRRR